MALDEAHPGVLRHALQCSPLRRQAIFSAIAALDLNRPNHLAHRLCPLARASDAEVDVMNLIMIVQIKFESHE
jgi:hypothetical protein